MKWAGWALVTLVLPTVSWTDHHATSLHRNWPVRYDSQTLQSPTDDSNSRNAHWHRRARLDQHSWHHVGQRRLDNRNSREDQIQNRMLLHRDNSYRHHQSDYLHVPTTPISYSKHHPGRRVCVRSSAASPHYHGENQMRLVYTNLPSGFVCCPGWIQATRLSYGCNKPVCPLPCQNGGICGVSGVCSCSKGYIGNQCQIDIDECVTEKPCAQICRNIPGSYECYCRSGFELQSDGQSCRKNDSDGTAFEVQDLEGNYGVTTTTKRTRDTEKEVEDNQLDHDYSDDQTILKRLSKLEKLFVRTRRRETETNELNNKVTMAVESINEVKGSIQHMESMRRELYDMRNKIKFYEVEARKIQYLTSRMLEFENRLRLCYKTTALLNGGIQN